MSGGDPHPNFGAQCSQSTLRAEIESNRTCTGRLDHLIIALMIFGMLVRAPRPFLASQRGAMTDQLAHF